ncbi:hypothetical protein [Pseudaminobacter salicylatoxidans]|uniref:hypothetical protein n=1 Tax=Pseudaminobacter salicylatoxidans TaxID=93369 RepID=UPI00037BA524|nr:hypothetical protein [Pseudaminobacter salicylatoxidans]
MKTAGINAGRKGDDKKQEVTSQTVAAQGVEGGDEPEKPAEEITSISDAVGDTDAIRSGHVTRYHVMQLRGAWSKANTDARSIFLAEIQFQAKASEDNGATGEATMRPADGMAGEVSRVDVGRTASATSERMDVTGGESAATNSPGRATRRLDDLGSVQDGLKMSTDGQPKTGLSTDCIERPIEARVTAGETAPHFPSAAPAAEAVAAVPQAPQVATAEFHPDPQTPQVDDGQPDPSSNDAGVKSNVPRVVGQVCRVQVEHSGQFEQQDASVAQAGNEAGRASEATVTNSKPDCLNPDSCNLHFTSALCWKCNDARTRRKLA